MSRSIDTRRPQELSSAQRDYVDCHPELRLLVRTTEGLEENATKTHRKSIRRLKGTPIYDKYHLVKRDYRRTKRRLQKAYLQEIKDRYRKEQPVIDIQTQIKGAQIKIEDPDKEML